MKLYKLYNHKALILIAAGFLLLGQAMQADAQSRHFATAGPAYTQSAENPARLVIRRIPNLGNHLIVDLRIDGVSVPGFGYGRSFEGFLRPGRHVLSVRPTPHARWLTRWEMILDVRGGHTYSFIATGDHSGSLVLLKRG